MDVADILRGTEIHLIIMDIMMPRQDGLTTLLQIRQSKNIPVILLSAKTGESDIVLGLSMGAGDYISKPYSPAELLARVKFQTKRYLAFGNYNASMEDSSPHLRNGGLDLNLKRKTVLCGWE